MRKRTKKLLSTCLGGGRRFGGRGGHDLVASGGGVRQHVLLDLAHHQDPVQRLKEKDNDTSIGSCIKRPKKPILDFT